MFNQKINDAMNEQINKELYSAYLYLSMASYFESENLPGFANWMHIQFKEEQFHAFKIYDYINERGGRVVLETIEKPKADFDGIVQIFEETLAHEKEVTASINDLMALAIENRDYASIHFLQWFVDEQVEEEATAEEILNHLKMVNGKGQAILMFDREFKQRVFTAPGAEK